MAHPSKILAISDEVLLADDGVPKHTAIATLSAALSTWKEVLVFTRRPGVAKRELALAENVLRNMKIGTHEKSVVPRCSFSMKRPHGSALLAENALNWTGSVPVLRSA